MLGLECSAGSGGGVEGAWAGESAGSVVGGAEDWSNVGSAASSFWSWTSMSGVGCRCRQEEALWEVEASVQGLVPERVRPVGMIGRCACRFDGGCQWRVVRYGVG